jgi:FMN-dependent oxidoreductase (nitrilotriacetate monooxygenase family)
VVRATTVGAMPDPPAPSLDLTVYVRNAGYHESAWKLADAEPGSVLELAHYVAIARTAERGALDAIFLPDSPGEAEFRSEFLPRSFLDPLQLLSAVAAQTERIGLIATASTTYSQPWDLARRIASLDHISGGRAGWNIVTTVEPAAAANFGADPHPLREARYERAEEFVEVVLALWDGWEDDALVGDRASGTWADPARLHPPRHHGRFFDVAGYLPFPRSPQGHPYLAQAGASPPGVALAARFADGIFTPQSDPASARAFRTRVHGFAAAAGRDPAHVRILPGLSFVLGSTDAEARERRRELEDAASGEFRWRNLANLAGLDFRAIDPDAPFPAELLAAAPKTSFGAAIYELAAGGPTTFREVSAQVSALPGGLDFTGTPEGMATLIEHWFAGGACDGFTIMPHRLPDELERFVDHVLPLLTRRGLARGEYRGTTLREHVGLPRPRVRAHP